MKYKTTKKAVNAGYGIRICIGYADLQHLLYYRSPVAYITRAEGWAADIYDFGNVAIVTGYAPFGNVKPDYELVRCYDRMAREIVNASDIIHSRRVEICDNLIAEFFKEVLKK